jgi:uncharacterized protein YjbI with pentapeptide repeats
MAPARRSQRKPAPPRPPREPLAEIDPAALDDRALEADGLRDVRLRHANLANLRARRTSVERVELHGCRMTGIQLAESALRDVTLADCRMDLAALRFCTVERVVFRGCQLQELDLVEAQLSSVVFEDCDLSGADLGHARFARSELRGCTLDGIVGAERLRGVAMPWPDVVGFAGQLAAAVGITVLFDDEEEER